jgi:hypothetical protein
MFLCEWLTALGPWSDAYLAVARYHGGEASYTLQRNLH